VRLLEWAGDHLPLQVHHRVVVLGLQCAISVGPQGSKEQVIRAAEGDITLDVRAREDEADTLRIPRRVRRRDAAYLQWKTPGLPHGRGDLAPDGRNAPQTSCPIRALSVEEHTEDVVRSFGDVGLFAKEEERTIIFHRADWCEADRFKDLVLVGRQPDVVIADVRTAVVAGRFTDVGRRRAGLARVRVVEDGSRMDASSFLSVTSSRPHSTLSAHEMGAPS